MRRLSIRTIGRASTRPAVGALALAGVPCANGRRVRVSTTRFVRRPGGNVPAIGVAIAPVVSATAIAPASRPDGASSASGPDVGTLAPMRIAGRGLAALPASRMAAARGVPTRPLGSIARVGVARPPALLGLRRPAPARVGPPTNVVSASATSTAASAGKAVRRPIPRRARAAMAAGMAAAPLLAGVARAGASASAAPI